MSSVKNRFWPPGFRLVCLSNLLLCASVYMQFPIMLMRRGAEPDYGLCGASAMALVAGMLVFGLLNSWLDARYNHKRLYLCFTLLMSTSILSLDYGFEGDGLFVAWQAIVGGLFGLSHSILGNSIVNDIHKSPERTGAANIFMWVGRFSMPLGILSGVWACTYFPSRSLFAAPAILAFMAMVAIMFVKMPRPLKAIDKSRRMLSFDRFFLIDNIMLGVALMPVAIVSGMALMSGMDYADCSSWAVGIAMAIWAQRVVFKDADERSEVVCGMIIMGVFSYLLGRPDLSLPYVSYVGLGFGTGLSSLRLLLYFLKSVPHGRRATSQNTYSLYWRFGMAVGILLMYYGFGICYSGLVLSAFAIVFYLLAVCPWFRIHKNRDIKFREH